LTADSRFEDVLSRMGIGRPGEIRSPSDILSRLPEIVAALLADGSDDIAQEIIRYEQTRHAPETYREIIELIGDAP
jgi:hypothetical protein